MNVVSEDCNYSTNDLQIIRPINGGTVILTEFDSSCPGELSGAFDFACKILEEYLPVCLPLKVSVSCESFPTYEDNAISKVNRESKEKFGYGTKPSSRTTPLSTIKGVLLGEYLLHNCTTSFYDSIPSIDFLYENSDITIIYNSNKFDDISFSLEPTPGDRYDFVSVALRDLLIGLGFTSNFRVNPGLGVIANPTSPMLPFEIVIDNALGENATPQSRYKKAVSGELLLSSNVNHPPLKLYAPENWDNSTSLRFFKPDESVAISNILSHSFGKGTVARSLKDSYQHYVFNDLLGWEYNYTVSTGNISSSTTGSNSVCVPYLGSSSIASLNPSNTSLGFTDNDMEVASSPVSTKLSSPVLRETSERLAFFEFIDSFRLFQTPDDGYDYREGISISALKKDGSWDLVYFLPYIERNSTVNMANWTFNCDKDEYARSPEGYLRIRYTTARSTSQVGVSACQSKYFVADYLPQTIAMKAKKKPVSIGDPLANGIEANSINAATSTYRIFLKNVEGLNRVVIECLKKGSRLPIKYEVKDFKCGYYDLSINGESTITAVGYNANGYSRSEPITLQNGIVIIVPQILANRVGDEIRFSINSQVDNSANIVAPLNISYSITSFDSSDSQPVLSGNACDNIDISSLKSGLYILTYNDGYSTGPNTYKFKK